MAVFVFVFVCVRVSVVLVTVLSFIIFRVTVLKLKSLKKFHTGTDDNSLIL